VNLSSDALDAIVRHQIDLTRYSNGVALRIIAVLNRADADLFAALTAALERLPATSYTVQWLESMLASVRGVNAQAYAGLLVAVESDLQALAPHEALWQAALYRNAGVAVTTITAEQAYAAAMARPFQGRLLKEWAQSIEVDRMTRIRDSIRMGYVEQKTIGQMVREIRGTRAKGYADGLIEIDRRHAEAVVRTAVSHTAGMARDRFYDENADVLGELQWVSTLDGRTSFACRLRDGKRYTTRHKPVGHSIPWGAGPGRLHWNCRSTSIALLKGQETLFGQRAAKDGPVAAGETYGDWLKRQPAAVQDDILGATRGKLFRDGGLEIESFANDKGRVLTIEQLRERDGGAFRRAGL
jgi:hypothetical protein